MGLLFNNRIRVGRLFLGPKWRPSVPQDWGWGVSVEDPSDVAQSRGGQEFGERLPQHRLIDFTLSWLTRAEALDNALAMARRAGAVGDVLAIESVTGSNLAARSVFGRLTSLPPILNRATNLWTQKFTVRERL